MLKNRIRSEKLFLHYQKKRIGLEGAAFCPALIVFFSLSAILCTNRMILNQTVAFCAAVIFGNAKVLLQEIQQYAKQESIACHTFIVFIYDQIVMIFLDFLS